MAIVATTLTLAVPATAPNTSWGTYVNAVAQDAAYATRSTSTTTPIYFQYSSNATSVVPSTAIVGVSITLRAYAAVSTASARLAVGPGTTGGPAAEQTLTTTPTDYTFGGPTNSLGVMSASDLATISVRGLSTTTNTTVYIDSCVVTVYTDDSVFVQPLTLTWAGGNLTNPTNVATSNNVYATYTETTIGSNRYARWSTDAASKLPAEAVVVGFVMNVEYKVSTVASSPTLTAGPGSFGAATNATPASPTTADAIYQFGGPSDALGAKTRSDVATASIRYTQSSATSTTHSIDWVTATVYWKYPPTGPNKLFFGRPL